MITQYHENQEAEQQLRLPPSNSMGEVWGESSAWQTSNLPRGSQSGKAACATYQPVTQAGCWPSPSQSLLSRPKSSALGELLKGQGVDRKYLLLGANKRQETPLTVPGAPFFTSYSSKTAGRLAIVMSDFPGKKLYKHQWQIILEFCKCQQKDV